MSPPCLIAAHGQLMVTILVWVPGLNTVPGITVRPPTPACLSFPFRGCIGLGLGRSSLPYHTSRSPVLEGCCPMAFVRIALEQPEVRPVPPVPPTPAWVMSVHPRHTTLP